MFFYQGCQVTYKIINPYYKGLKKTFHNTFLVKQSFNKLIKFLFLMNIIQNVLTPFYTHNTSIHKVLFLKWVEN